MNPLSSFFLILLPLTVLSIVTAQDRAPHGIANESPVAFSPSAYDFFHSNMQPTSTTDPCANLNCSPLPVAAQVEARESRESTSESGRSRVGAGGIAAIVIGISFAVLLAIGVYYVTVKRQNNMRRANSVQQDGQSPELV